MLLAVRLLKNVQYIARLAFGIGHHLDEIIAMGGKAEAICGNDGMNGVVMGGHVENGSSEKPNNLDELVIEEVSSVLVSFIVCGFLRSITLG